MQLAEMIAMWDVADLRLGSSNVRFIFAGEDLELSFAPLTMAASKKFGSLALEILP
jgi:hypothetical protein